MLNLKKYPQNRVNCMKKVIMLLAYSVIWVSLNAYGLTGDEVYSLCSPSIYTLYGLDKNQQPIAQGSAVAITENILATNCHVAMSGNIILVKMHNNYEAGLLLYKDETEDLCFVTVQSGNFFPVKLKNSEEVDIGEEVYAIGNPEGLEKTISNGIISNKQKKNNILYLQTDAPITFGSSGGGLFDTEGYLIGITTWSDTQSGDLNFAIPSDYVSEILKPSLQSKNESPQIKNDTISGQSAMPTLPAPSSSNSEIKEIGVFGKNKIEVYQSEQLCFLLIHGHNLNGKPSGTSLWIPEKADQILFFPMANSISEIVSAVANDEKNTNKFTDSYSFLLLNNTIYKLMGKPIKNQFPVLVTDLNENPANTLMEGEYFVVQSKDQTSQEGFNTVIYGLYGFSEAMAAYKTTCK